MDYRLNVFRNLIFRACPELIFNTKIRARVVAVHETGGSVSNFKPLYSADVQPLLTDFSDDPDQPVIPDIEIPVLWSGPDRGVYCLPAINSIVRLGWYYGDPSQPYIDSVLGYGFNCPDHPPNTMIIQHSDGTKIELGQVSLIQILAATVELAGSAHPVAWGDIVKQIFDSHTHPVGSGNTGAPNQSMDGHQSQKVFTG
jgi:hypothetical protein